MQHIKSLQEIADHYDAFIIDLWGVMHDGTQLYAGAKDAISVLYESGKQVIFLSNAPRRRERPEATLLEFGVKREQFMSLVTSGQVAYDALKDDPYLGKAYYYLGPSKDEDILDGLASITRVDNPVDADFILNAGFEYDFQPEAEIEPTLQALRAENLPLLCINPDMEVVKQDGTRLLCAGWVAARYAALGGKVEYVGKPYKAVYDTCFNLLKNLSARGRVSAKRAPNILAIGDNLLTDIKGANAMEIDSLLITGGILKSEKGEFVCDEVLETLCEKAQATPTYVAELFAA